MSKVAHHNSFFGEDEKPSVKKANIALVFLKFFKYATAVTLIVFFLRQVYQGVIKMNEKKMTMTSSADVEKLFTYPSITVCITMDINFTNGFNNKAWLEPYKYDFKFPFPELGVVEDAGLTQFAKFESLNDPEVLKKLGISYLDIWTPSIQANFEEPSRCFTYQPKGRRSAGFRKSITFRIKSRDDPAIAFFAGVHNHDAFVPNLARVFGNDYAIVFARKGQLIGTRFEISRTNFTDLNRDDHPCSDDPAISIDEQPGLIISPEGPKTLNQCIIDFYHSNLNCRLPWSNSVIVPIESSKPGPQKTVMLNGTLLENCTKDEQYLEYKKLIKQIDDASDATFWKLIGCTPRCKFTKFNIKPIYDSNFDSLQYVTGKEDGARVDVSFFFPSPEIELTERIWVYDGSNLAADIGGFLGLFLGASLYTLAEILIAYLENLIQRKKSV